MRKQSNNLQRMGARLSFIVGEDRETEYSICIHFTIM